MVDLGDTVSVGGDPAAGGGSETHDNRAETNQAPSATVFVGGGARSGTHDNRFEALVSGGGIVGGAPPSIQNFVPPVGTTLGRLQGIGFDLVDDNALKRGMILVTMGSEQLVVHDGDTFRGRFSGTRVIMSDALHRFSNVLYSPGWSAPPTFEFLVTDLAGQEAV
jgi:hypothetical protein